MSVHSVEKSSLRVSAEAFSTAAITWPDEASALAWIETSTAG